MDERDLRIIHAISRLGTGSREKIEDATGIPKSTVHYRVEKLRDEGIFTNDLYDVDHDAVGLQVTVISEITAIYSQGYHQIVGDKLTEIDGVDQVYFTMGDTDFIVIARLSGTSEILGLVEQYEAIDEVQRTSSKFVIDTIKKSDRPLANYSLETLLETLSDDP